MWLDVQDRRPQQHQHQLVHLHAHQDRPLADAIGQDARRQRDDHQGDHQDDLGDGRASLPLDLGGGRGDRQEDHQLLPGIVVECREELRVMNSPRIGCFAGMVAAGCRSRSSPLSTSPAPFEMNRRSSLPYHVRNGGTRAIDASERRRNPHPAPQSRRGRPRVRCRSGFEVGWPRSDYSGEATSQEASSQPAGSHRIDRRANSSDVVCRPGSR